MKGCSLPRHRLTGWLVDSGPDVPADIRMALLTSLFGTLPFRRGDYLVIPIGICLPGTSFISCSGTISRAPPMKTGWEMRGQ